jgi:hypothetical protein
MTASKSLQPRRLYGESETVIVMFEQRDGAQLRQKKAENAKRDPENWPTTTNGPDMNKQQRKLSKTKDKDQHTIGDEKSSGRGADRSLLLRMASRSGSPFWALQNRPIHFKTLFKTIKI